MFTATRELPPQLCDDSIVIHDICSSSSSSSSSSWHQKSMKAKLEVGSGGQLSPSVRPHNLTTGFLPPSATVVSAEPFLHGTGTLRCLQKEMATYRHWSVSLWQDPDDETMSHTVESCPLTKLNGGLPRLNSADEDAVFWLTNYGSWHACEKKKTTSKYHIQSRLSFALLHSLTE